MRNALATLTLLLAACGPTFEFAADDAGDIVARTSPRANDAGDDTRMAEDAGTDVSPPSTDVAAQDAHPPAPDAGTDTLAPVDACVPLDASTYCTASTCYSVPDGCGGTLDCASLPVCTTTGASCGPDHEVCGASEICLNATSCVQVTTCTSSAECADVCGAGTLCVENVCGGLTTPAQC